MEKNYNHYNAVSMTITNLPNNYNIEYMDSVYFSIVKVNSPISYTENNTNIVINIITPQSHEEYLNCVLSGMYEIKEKYNDSLFRVVTYNHEQCELFTKLFVEMTSFKNVTLNAKGKMISGLFHVNSIVLADPEDTSIQDYIGDTVRSELNTVIRTVIEGEKPNRLNNVITTREGLNVYYQLYKSRIPESLEEWIEKAIRKGNVEKACRFLEIDWSVKKLILPSKEQAQKILDELIYGQKNAKKRIISLLEIVRRSGRLSYNILLNGPAGVGKTTFAQAISRIFNLPISVIPMAGIQDAEAFSGFANTYNNSSEGLFTTFAFEPKYYDVSSNKYTTVQQICQVAFLNELDKVNPEGTNHGSVQSVLLRMLDDNREFYDVFYGTSYPLENVMIIADVNDISKLQKPLLDRFIVINIEGYNTEEKKHIFNDFVFPRALMDSCVSNKELSISDEAVNYICQNCITPGVRELRHTADTIIGDYLYNNFDAKTKTIYSEDMVRALGDANELSKPFFRL